MYFPSSTTTIVPVKYKPTGNKMSCSSDNIIDNMQWASNNNTGPLNKKQINNSN